MNMNRHCGIIKFILLGVVCISLLPVSVHAQKYTEFIPGEVWKDTDGNPINAHGRPSLSRWYLLLEIGRAHV